MKRILIVPILAISLAGCGTVNSIVSGTLPNPVSKNTLATVQASYGTALAAANAYKQSCIRKLIDRSCRQVVVVLQNADNYAYGQIVVARKFVKNNPNVDASAVIDTAKSAVDAFITAQSVNGVR